MNKVETPEQAKALLERAPIFMHHSLAYVDASDLMGYNCLQNDDQALLLVNKKGMKTHVQWAANHAQDLADALLSLQQRPVVIEFIPESFLPDLLAAGFVVEAEFVDFFNEDITSVFLDDTQYSELEFLKVSEQDFFEAAEITRSCEGISRGFFAEEPEFFREWLEDEYSNVIVSRDGDGRLQAICCVSVYALDSERGPIVWIREVAVSPQLQGRGIGRKLVMQALCYGKHHGAKRSFLACDVENVHAIRLYNRFGFEQKPGRGQINMILHAASKSI